MQFSVYEIPAYFLDARCETKLLKEKENKGDEIDNCFNWGRYCNFVFIAEMEAEWGLLAGWTQINAKKRMMGKVHWISFWN